MSKSFGRIAHSISNAAGRPFAFATACVVVLVWAVSGPLFQFSDTWQLVINTGTTIVTFLMVFLIQNAQIRDTAALHLKLDELIRATEGAKNTLIALEQQGEEEIAMAKQEISQAVADAPPAPARLQPSPG